MSTIIDGAIVAGHCDGAIMVVESGGVSYRVLQKVKRQLERSGCRILGTVLNRVNMQVQGYYGITENTGDIITYMAMVTAVKIRNKSSRSPKLR